MNTMDETNRAMLNTMLHRGVVTVIFLKKDGSERVMNCTLSKQHLPAYSPSSSNTACSPSKPHEPNVESLRVYDIDEEDWRSFRYDSVKQMSLILG